MPGRYLLDLKLGLGIAVLLDYYIPLELVGSRDVPGVVPIIMVAVLLVGSLAAFAPARRALRLAATEALHDMG